jgi:microcompartment protein CcmL/EutN
MNGAIGLLETKGANPLIVASDAMCKAASVEVVRMIEIGSGYATIVVRGDVGSVKAAVDAGAEAASAAGEVIAAHVIPQPHEDLLSTFA